MGFVRQAIRSGVPIVPVATVGGHDTVFVLSEGRWLANGLDRVSGLKRKLRGSQLPIVLGFIVPLVVWLINKDKSDKGWLIGQAKEALNFQITIAIAWFVAILLSFLLIGFLLFQRQFVQSFMRAGIR